MSVVIMPAPSPGAPSQAPSQFGAWSAPPGPIRMPNMPIGPPPASMAPPGRPVVVGSVAVTVAATKGPPASRASLSVSAPVNSPLATRRGMQSAALGTAVGPCGLRTFLAAKPVDVSPTNAMRQSDQSGRARAPLYPPSDDLRLTIYPGDVLFVNGNGAISRVGQAGGFMGHVLVVLGAPRRIDWGSEESKEINAAWPGGVEMVWKVPTIESSRDTKGLHRAEMILRVDKKSRKLLLIGDWVAGKHVNELGVMDDEVVELWQSPGEIRSQIFLELMSEVLSEMTGVKSWSLATAGMAMIQSAALGDQFSMAEVKACWESAPICTSVVIAFWQRYLVKLAQRTDQSQQDLISTWMPLKADRGLPGELLVIMRECGWVCVSRFPPAAAAKAAAAAQSGSSLASPRNTGSQAGQGMQAPFPTLQLPLGPQPQMVFPTFGGAPAGPRPNSGPSTMSRPRQVSPVRPPQNQIRRSQSVSVRAFGREARAATGGPRFATSMQQRPVVGAPPGLCSVAVRPR